MTVIAALRLLAAILALLSAAAAAEAGMTTRSLIATARHAKGTVAALHDGLADITVPSPSGQVSEITQPYSRQIAPGQTVDLLVQPSSNGQTDIRLDDAHTLWHPMWTWIEIAFAALLAAIYGKQLLTDPLSVIGFKSWRLGKHR